MLAINQTYRLIKEALKEEKLKTFPSFSNPSVIINERFYENGQRRFFFTFNKGRLDGFGRIWFENGQLKKEDPFHKGVLHGLARSWYKTGQIKTDIHYCNNQYDGQRREWFPNGNLMVSCEYKLGKLEGQFNEFYRSGQVKESGRYLEGERHGIFKEYDEEGVCLNHELYVRGVCYTGKVKRILKPDMLSAEMILKMDNAAIRRILLEEFGYERFLAQVSGEVIDQDGEQELIKVKWHKDEEPLMLVKVKCSTTNIFYTLRVPPHTKTVREAVAWTFGLEEFNYQPSEET